MPNAATMRAVMADIDAHLKLYPDPEHSWRFELETMRALAAALRLPLYDRPGDARSVRDRVTWFGSETGPRNKAPAGPDGVVRARGFHLLVYATLNTGAGQAQKELEQFGRHARERRLPPHRRREPCISVFVPRALRGTSLDFIRTHNSGPEKSSVGPQVPLEPTALAGILEAAEVAIGLRDADVLRVLGLIEDRTRQGTEVVSFREQVDGKIRGWTREVLEGEIGAIVGLAAYQAMCGRPNRYVDAGELLSDLLGNAHVESCLKRCGQRLHAGAICDALVGQRLALEVASHPGVGRLLCAVPACDCAARLQRVAVAITEAAGSGTP